MIVGVDVGGTFIDLVAVDGNGKVGIHKIPSYPYDQGRGVLDGLKSLGISPPTVERLVHGTTVGTNAIVERRGAKVAFVTNTGFRDIVEIGRAKRMIPSTLFKPFFVRPRSLVPRSLCFEIRERTLYSGEVLHRPEEKDVIELCRQLRLTGAEAVAICLLHSYRNPESEEQVQRIILKYLGSIPTSISSQVVPEYREFERYSTTVINAYIQPLMESYLRGLDKALTEDGYKKRILTVASSGGVLPLQVAIRSPVRTIRSGPAAGVVQSVLVARQLTFENIITCDMGGTSTDVCLVKSYTPSVSTDNLIDGFPLKIPQIEINSVGAGGGSIAWVDVDGGLKVGPHSAGADPGPAAYGRGGRSPTVTDANLLLNRLSPRQILGGTIRLYPERAEEAFTEIAGRFPQLKIHELAEGVIRLAMIRMVGAIREISIQRGHDPREFVLIAFGGAGPMHATQVAEELGIRKVLIPRLPGNFSALGLANCDLKYDYVKTKLSVLSKLTVEEIAEEIGQLREQAYKQLQNDGVEPHSMLFYPSLDIRYWGQAFELHVPIQETSLPAIPSSSLSHIAAKFNQLHHKTFGHSDPGAELELVNVRLSALGVVSKVQLPVLESRSDSLGDAEIEKRQVFFNGQFLECPTYERNKIPISSPFKGPAILEEFGTTTIVFPEWQAEADIFGNLILTPPQAAKVGEQS